VQGAVVADAEWVGDLYVAAQARAVRRRL
jgi:hypothetical protein